MIRRVHRGFSLVMAIAVLGGMVVIAAAFLGRVDSETRRVGQLQRAVYSLMAANEALEKMRSGLLASGRLPGSLEHRSAEAEVKALIAPTSAAARSYYAFVSAACQGTGVVVFATLRREGGSPGAPARGLVENKAVFYGAHKIDEPAVRDTLLARLKTEYKQLRSALDAERELASRGALKDTFAAYLAESGLGEEAKAALLEGFEH